jgi:hypothetical protein
VPYILRPLPEASEEASSVGMHRRPQYQFIGECYVQGRMEGNVVEEQKTFRIPPEMFDIR